MFTSILIGSGLTIITTFIHAAAIVISARFFVFAKADRWARRSGAIRSTEVAGLVLIMFIASVVEALAWALVYVALGAIDDREQALYFSMVTFTTLGYGDVVLGEQWRVLASFQAATGIIMFGWTTAFIVAAVHRLFAPANAARAGA